MGKSALVLWLKPRLVQEGPLWTAYFDEMELFGSGETPQAALNNLREHVVAHCGALANKGVLKEALDTKKVRYEEKGDTLPILVPA